MSIVLRHLTLVAVLFALPAYSLESEPTPDSSAITTDNPVTSTPDKPTQRNPPPQKKFSATKINQLTWDDLVPWDYKPDDLLAKYGKKLKKLRDGDPEAQRILEEVRASWTNAPVVEALDGKPVKMAGYVIPFDGNGKTVKEFLLVPYFGSCIHVPPPPSNQIVYVRAPPKGAKIKEMFDTVWVTGVMHATSHANDVAQAGYTLTASKVEPY